MRSFEERKAEIFRRSNERIRERKRRRNRILSLSVPLCLILVVSAFFLPNVLSRKDKNAFPEEGMDMVAGTELSRGNYIQVESFGGESALLSDVSNMNSLEVERICNLIKDLFPIEEESILDSEGDAEKNENSDQSTHLASSADYRIIFVKEGQVIEVYLLKGSVLTEEKTGRRAVLTEKERALILEEIGLTVKEN